ncbi:gag protease polyprotein [Cucumis melo var. makuwa]|uniref:Gag protease polyprotein n=1 Tax=Cucumis melo var. makuwa TaxID=1194695 RepID=A0A5D3DVK9_CUCMM|nr:gag protease polyprotein [Cucumis melo var. makuwa]
MQEFYGKRSRSQLSSTWVDSFGCELEQEFSYSTGKRFLTTGPRTETGNVAPMPRCSVYYSYVDGLCCELEYYVVEGLRVRKPLVLPVDALGFELGRSIIRWFSIDCGVTISFIYGVVYLTGTVSFGIPRLICVSFEINRLICAAFGITRLMCASFGITRLICASFRITRLICASFGITRLMCKGMARGRPMRCKKDASFISLCVILSCPSREMLPRRGARRGGRGGRGRGAGRVQPEIQPVAQAIDPAAPVTHANLTAMKQRFRDLIMQMREQQQPAPPAHAPSSVVPQGVLDQLSVEAKHLRDFRKYNPTTFDGSLEDPTKA